MSVRTEAMITEVVIASRPIGDRTERERAIGQVLDAIQLELVGVTSIGEWCDRLAWQSSALTLADRDIEARMMAAAALVLAS